MIQVLMVLGAVPARVAVLTDALEQFRAAGAKVRIACTFAPARIPAAADLAELHLMPTAKELGPRFDRVINRASPARRPWLRAQRDPWIRRHARSADVLVALDQQALHTVWQLAHRYRRADAVFGIAPALRAVEKRAADPQRYRRRSVATAGPSPKLLVHGTRTHGIDLAKAALQAASGRRVMRSSMVRWMWQQAVAAPGVPERYRAEMARRVQTSMNRAGKRASAGKVAVAASAKLTSPTTKAQLLAPVAEAQLAEGRVPEHLSTVFTGELAVADSWMKRRNPHKASGSALRALDLMFHRIAHFDGFTSPLAEDPEGYLAPLHNSEVGKLMAAAAGRAEPARFPSADRPHRMLFFTGLNDNFVMPIIERYEAMPDVEVRRLNLVEDSIRPVLSSGRKNLVHQRLGFNTDHASAVQQAWGEHVAWADTVFVDWLNLPAALLTLIDPGSTRVIVRLHSFEAFTWWPHLTDLSRIDDLVFVSEHLRDLTLAAVPRLREPGGPRTHVISNAMDLQRYVAPPKPADARFMLGLIGLSSLAKDPRWALEVLRELRRRDSRYRLKLIGDDLNPELSPAVRAYVEELDRDLAELEGAGALVRTGRTEDVPGALTDVGVMLSTSVRESFHCGLVEGVASGAVPVVRDWPFFAGRAHNARTLFPSDWVVSTPAEAAERILAVTGSEESWRAAAQAAASHTLSTWDWTVTQKDFDRLLLEPPTPSDG